MLEVNSISKSYGDKKAADGISFSVSEGEIFGLLGPNGAGKTTTIRMIMNIITPDSGSIKIFSELFSESLTDRIGYLPEERGLYKKRKVIEVLVYFAVLKGMDKSIAKTKAEKFLEKFELYDYRNKRVEELSKGMQQKVQFIASVLHDPDLIILDEPFAGLDPLNTQLVKDIILEMKNKNKTIILSTHMMEQAEKLCDRIMLINKGKNVLYGKLSEIKKNYGVNSVIIGLKEVSEAATVKTLPVIKNFEDHGNYLEIKMKLGEDPQELLEYLIKNKIKINRFEIKEPSLNEIFIGTVKNEDK
jgi:ABC-2 type transport system ATP-binding protein